VGTGAVQWSDEFHRIHGVDPLEFEGTIDAYMACIHPADQQRVRSEMEAAVASGRRFEDEYRAVRPDGEVRWVYARAEPMVGSAEVVVGLRGIGQDVTDG
jgi:PAS domain S-box-containing protein